MAGSAAPDQALLDALVDGDWDPEEYDKKMAAAFGDDYYEVRLVLLGTAGVGSAALGGRELCFVPCWMESPVL